MSALAELRARGAVMRWVPEGDVLAWCDEVVCGARAACVGPHPDVPKRDGLVLVWAWLPSWARR